MGRSHSKKLLLEEQILFLKSRSHSEDACFLEKLTEIAVLLCKTAGNSEVSKSIKRHFGRRGRRHISKQWRLFNK